ncbi:malate permease [Clostridium carboxidivorans P7]|uniref:Citrate carrier protein n=1 Tax=Clostridium carboxidivorans P7 TaxID=536227 RepID=C6PY90_9CLOT|nr:2-hydroxycarboxylate transporter family protein [Clostridium carboxidivorans]AKN32065.1 malate permease [Clostridium carboxidivorans P7]EET85766.1 Citrate carrier protein [Clostridium carboxidivorans P7]EFG87792.1 citrate carrier protein, CCS family [Clostridium carboxidivorans P7]
MQTTTDVPRNTDNLFSKILQFKIGEIPIPLFIAISIIIFLSCHYKLLPIDMIGGFAVVMVMGLLLGEIGARVPVLKNIGGPAICTIFIPSALVYYKLLDPTAIKSITALMKTSNFLYLYISVLVVGSILGMNRKVMIKGFVKMFVPLVVGTICAAIGGIIIGLLFGYTPYKSFFFVIAPIVSGGIGEGILPLSVGYSGIIHGSQNDLVAKLVPAAMIGNVIAIMISGLLMRIAIKKPKLTGNGVLVKTGDDQDILQAKTEEKPIDFKLMGAGFLIACTFFIFGTFLSKFIGIPGAIIMIITAAIVKYLKLLPKHIELGAHQIYSLVSKTLTWPLLIGVGVVYTPWSSLIATVTPGYIAICIASVTAMVTSGFYVGKAMNMYPIESALVTSCHSGLGGTGDVAILSGANRMELMPFSQVSTRLGGAGTVILATILLKLFV